MKLGDIVYCKKDFFREKSDEYPDRPTHPFFSGKEYRMFVIEPRYDFEVIIIEEGNTDYIEYFLKHEHAISPDNVDNYFDFDEYFCETIAELRNLKLLKINGI